MLSTSGEEKCARDIFFCSLAHDMAFFYRSVLTVSWETTTAREKSTTNVLTLHMISNDVPRTLIEMMVDVTHGSVRTGRGAT